MYIIAIAWLYVALLAAITDTTVVGGVLTFVFLGLLPMSLFLWLFGTPARRRKLREKDDDIDSAAQPNESDRNQ
ncbi:hypothetical protein [Denitromonas iodatirespirans]|uniref:Transmembrane protein n=1 Tax=Denitromonas iodatirespirans TaxID=2795389 RepID=A0A944DEM1_DENI1|nr:hypothetical protein [Denitromonas iodatirespirans]MBT0963651.1 hypothetical protein [Denitromonas iodatirespirans]